MKTVRFVSRLAYNNCSYPASGKIAAVLVGSLFIATAAQIALPIKPVPVNLQTSAVLFVSMLFGPSLGSQMVIAYLLEGVCGLPVFTHLTSGWQVLVGPTGGYLIGFVPAAFVFGYLLEQGWEKHAITIFLAALAGTLILFIPGYFMLAKFVGYHQAYIFGVTPFYVTELVKLLTITLITPFFWQQKISKK